MMAEIFVRFYLMIIFEYVMVIMNILMIVCYLIICYLIFAFRKTETNTNNLLKSRIFPRNVVNLKKTLVFHELKHVFLSTAILNNWLSNIKFIFRKQKLHLNPLGFP